MTRSSLQTLHAGRLTAFWEPGGLRYLQWGHVEIIRRIYGAVRDRNWGAAPGIVSDVRIEQRDDSFRIDFTSRHRGDEIDFIWNGVIMGNAEGTIRFEFDGEARSTFLRNRIGLNVLHPAECAGSRTRQSRTDGSIIEGAFPELIEPQIVGQYSHRDLKQLSHEVTGDTWCDVNFEGDVFETEDQRNWIDASFKTYSTPLAIPFPVEIAAGTRVRQAVTIAIREVENVARVVSQPDDFITVDLGSDPKSSGGPIHNLPEMGLSKDDGPPLKRIEADLVAWSGFAHLRVDLPMGLKRWSDILERGRVDCAELRLPMELAVTLPARDMESALGELRHRLRDNAEQLARIIVFRAGEPATSAETMRQARRILGQFKKPLGGGSNAHFCELNREQAQDRAGISEYDFLCWPATPQVHATDEVSIAETSAGIAATIHSARAFASGKPLVISPITLKPRFNAVATTSEPLRPGELPAHVDSRQLSLFAAGWSVAALKPLFEAGVFATTMYDLAGWAGLFERGIGSRMPSLFPSHPLQTFPLFFPVSDLAGFSWRGRSVPARSSRPREVEAVTIAWKDEQLTFLGNMTDLPQRVRIRNLPSDNEVAFRRIAEDNRELISPDNWHLDEREFWVEHHNPVERMVEVVLPPYAFGRLIAPIEPLGG